MQATRVFSDSIIRSNGRAFVPLCWSTFAITINNRAPQFPSIWQYSVRRETRHAVRSAWNEARSAKKCPRNLRWQWPCPLSGFGMAPICFSQSAPSITRTPGYGLGYPFIVFVYCVVNTIMIERACGFSRSSMYHF